MAMVLTINAVDRTSVLRKGSLRVEQRAVSFVSTCSLTLIDESYNITINIEDDISVVDGATTYFVGRVVTVDYRPFTSNSRNILLECQDKNAPLNEVVIDDTESYPIGHPGVTADADIIDDLFTTYFPAVDSTTHVATLVDPLTIVIGPCTIRQALSQICAQTGGLFYMDDSNKLHYFDAEAIAAGWFLSDTPDQINSFSYFPNPRKQSRGVTRLDGVFVVGQEISGWRGNHAVTDRTTVVWDPSITTQSALDARGDNVLDRYALAQDTYFVSTAKKGLYAGIDIRFVCTIYGVDDTFPVRKMVIKWDEAGDPYFELELGDLFDPYMIEEQRRSDYFDVVAGEPGAPVHWSHVVVFSATDHDTLAWAAGDITLPDGTIYSIDAGNTGNMAMLTWVYLDLDVSETVFQTSTTAADAVGARKLRIAWGDPVVAGIDCIFLVFEGFGLGTSVDEDNIVEGAITTTKIGTGAVTTPKVTANAITAGKIDINIGNMLYNAATGLLLLGPHNEINTTEWWSARRQKATLSGAFHQEAGYWKGTKGLVAEEATTNLVPNPSMEVNTTGWVAAFGLGTLSRITTEHVFGIACGKFVGDGAYAYSRAWYPSIAVAASTEYHFSVYVKAFDSAGIGKPMLLATTGDSSGETTTAFTLTSGWRRYTHSHTTNGADTVLTVAITINNDASGFAFVFDGAQLEAKVGYITTYCDGSLGAGYAWVGAVHASSSTRAATIVNLDSLTDLINNDVTTSFRVVAQMPYESVGSWSTATPQLWDFRGANDNNRVFLEYDTADDKFKVYINGAIRLASAAQSFSKGDWFDIVVTLDFTTDDYHLYINGALSDSDTTALAVPTGLVKWKLGGEAVDLAKQAGFNISEYAVFNRVLTADETAALYEMNRPIVDTGAVDVPGIYILDGKFRMASSTTGARMELDEAGLIFKESGGSTLIELDATDASFMLQNTGVGARMILDASGLVFKDAGGNNLIELNSSNGSFVLRSATAGNARVDIRSTEITGYNAANVKQFYLSATDGKAYAGAGVVRLDSSGLAIVGDTDPSDAAEKIRFKYDDSGTERTSGYIYGDYTGGGDATLWLIGYKAAGDPSAGGRVYVYAWDAVTGVIASVECKTGTGSSNGKVRVSAGTLFRVGTGTSDPTDDVEDGCLFYRTDTDRLRLRANGAWINAA